MPDEDRQFDRLEEEFPTVAEQAFATARARVLASGQTVLHSENGYIYEVYPNGDRVFVKKIDPPISVVSGHKITIG